MAAAMPGCGLSAADPRAGVGDPSMRARRLLTREVIPLNALLARPVIDSRTEEGVGDGDVSVVRCGDGLRLAGTPASTASRHSLGWCLKHFCLAGGLTPVPHANALISAYTTSFVG